ncbi:hypothetical protein ACQPZX_06705 [Actinoplanes sp. CA-142083]|uniref:hypothetical protein n=1 Tax=Actinoplanes sp. CA-142083 TaxID=3239903 RepID=UPI003D8B3705
MGVRYAIATAARDAATSDNAGPADAVWRVQGLAAGPRRLPELTTLVIDPNYPKT